MFSSAHADMVLSVIEAIRGPISSPPCGQSGIRPQPSVAGGGDICAVSDTRVFIICHEHIAVLSRNIVFPSRFPPLCRVL